MRCPIAGLRETGNGPACSGLRSR
ncbi:MAG: hypothetical protein ACLQVD_16050 [Capsulimonadaceae bacterium]